MSIREQNEYDKLSIYDQVEYTNRVERERNALSDVDRLFQEIFDWIEEKSLYYRTTAVSILSSAMYDSSRFIQKGKRLFRNFAIICNDTNNNKSDILHKKILIYDIYTEKDDIFRSFRLTFNITEQEVTCEETKQRLNNSEQASSINVSDNS